MRKKVLDLIKRGRLTLVAVLCLGVCACGTQPGRDLSVAGAIDKFDTRRAASRAQAAQLGEIEDEQLGLRTAKNAKPLPQRRELLQVRVPIQLAVDDIADGVVATAISGTLSGVNQKTSATPTDNTNIDQRAVQSRLRAIDKRIDLMRRNLRTKQADYEREKRLLDQMDMRHAKARDLLLQSFKIENEKRLQTNIASLETQYQAAKPATILGLSENPELGTLALFGRNEMARPDEYVSLQKSFIFIGNDINTGVSLGRMDDIADEVGSRTLSVNLAGLRLPTALKSLARSINLQIYVSPQVNAATQKVSLDISRADALDIFDILIDNYGLAMAYDRQMSVARFYTREEFNERVAEAIQAAEQHNRRARDYLRISSLENDAAALRQIYQAYFQHPDDAGRARSLTNDAIIEDAYSPAIAAAIVSFKEQALANERELDALDLTQATERQTQAAMTQLARFALDDAKQIMQRLQDNRQANQARLELAEMAMAMKPVKPDMPTALATTLATPDIAPSFAAGPDAEVLRGRIIKDANLKTTEPIYTEKFTIYNSEGANSCDGAGAGDRVVQIKEELENYYSQLYPDALIAAEEAAERAAQRPGHNEADELVTGLVGTGIADIATDAPTNVPVDAPANAPVDAVNQATADDDMNVTNMNFTNSSFRRPTVTSVADTVIVTGFKHDVDLAASLIESLDQADKQVLVEVFMVNVVKNWQRQLQGRLQTAIRTAAKTDTDIADLGDTVRAALPDLIEVRDNGLIGVRGALKFADRAANANSFTLNNFRLGLAWTIDFMENNSLGRKVSSPTILALDGCQATIEKSETRYLPVTSTSAPIVTPGGQTVPGESSTTYEPRQAKLSLVVKPTINPLNDHVRLKVNFNDDFFVSTDANSDKIQSKIDTEFIAAPGDVIVLAGLYTEDNSKVRNGLPGTTSLPFISSILGTTSDAKLTQEMVIFLAPEVITPEAGTVPINSATYYDAQ